ncbi:MAG: ATP-dependent helicase [Clostridiales bacterium]|nr:ATP-dependent helicase [Clostridiales bacterium]
MKNKFSLSSAQIEAIDEIQRNLQIIACAGSGKTEVITRRIANILSSVPNVSAENIVAFTFTEKAAESMRNRILKVTTELGIEVSENMYIGTIHSFCYKLLNNFTEEFKNTKVLDTVQNHLFVQRYYNACGMNDLGINLYPTMNIKLFLNCIDKMIDDYENRECWESLHRTILNKYTKFLYDNGYIDYSLLIFESVKQIKENESVQRYLRSIKYLIVDEYQDINDIQEKLIAEIAKAGANICVVGDDDQSIYHFRGSNSENMIHFSDRYNNVRQIYLDTNYRCSPCIVDIADTVIRNNTNRLPKIMRSGIENNEIKAEAYCCNSENEQYRYIATKIKETNLEGVPYCEIAVLVRKGKYIDGIISALDKLDIPYDTANTTHFFEGEYFKKFTSTIEMLSNIEKPSLYNCWKDIASFDNFNSAFAFLRNCSLQGNLRLDKIISIFCEKIKFLDEFAIDIDTRLSDYNGIIQILSDYEDIYYDYQLSQRVSGVLNFIEYQAKAEYKYHNFKKKDNEEKNAVQIITVHKSKGLEFDTVFIPELEESEFPIRGVNGKQYWHVLRGRFEKNKHKYQTDIEDERKLFYVAVTRAKRKLFFTYGRPKKTISSFLIEASKSQYLHINKNDLINIPEKQKSCIKRNVKRISISRDEKNKMDNKKIKPPSVLGEETSIPYQVKHAKSELIIYYGKIIFNDPSVRNDMMNLANMTNEEIINKAKELNLI